MQTIHRKEYKEIRETAENICDMCGLKSDDTTLGGFIDWETWDDEKEEYVKKSTTCCYMNEEGETEVIVLCPSCFLKLRDELLQKARMESNYPFHVFKF